MSLASARRERSRFDAEVIVVGAGVVGACAALGLAQHDLRVILIEAHVPPSWQAENPDLRVYAIASDSVDLLTKLAIWPHIQQRRAHAYRCMRVWDAGSDSELIFSADQLGISELGWIVEHRLLVDPLWQACQRHSQITCLAPQRAVSLAHTEDGVSLTLDDERTLRAPLLIGADGAASKIRQLAAITTQDFDYQQSAIIGYVRTEKPHENTAWQRFTTQGPLAFLPVDVLNLVNDHANNAQLSHSASIVWSQPSQEAQRRLALDDDAFCAELTRAFDARLGRVMAVSQRHCLPLRRQLASATVHNRIALIGDAAHVVHPLAGQGVNLGLRDVGALLVCFDEAKQRGQSLPSLHKLQRWARTRHSDNYLAAKSFEWINRIYSNDSPLATLLRGHALGLANRISPINRALWHKAAG